MAENISSVTPIEFTGKSQKRKSRKLPTNWSKALRTYLTATDTRSICRQCQNSIITAFGIQY